MKPEVTSFFHEESNTVCHVVREAGGRHAAIIDAALDFDEAAGRTKTEFADRVIAFVREQGLMVDWILETHAHADHLSAAPYIKERLGGVLGIGENIRVVQDIFGKRGTEAGQFRTAHGICGDSQGALYVTEVEGQRVQKFVKKS